MKKQLENIDISTGLEFSGPDAFELNVHIAQFLEGLDVDPIDAAYQFRRNIESQAIRSIARRATKVQPSAKVTPIRRFRDFDGPGAA